jgi:hypothetical protein
VWLVPLPHAHHAPHHAAQLFSNPPPYQPVGMTVCLWMWIITLYGFVRCTLLGRGGSRCPTCTIFRICMLDIFPVCVCLCFSQNRVSLALCGSFSLSVSVCLCLSLHANKSLYLYVYDPGVPVRLLRVYFCVCIDELPCTHLCTSTRPHTLTQWRVCVAGRGVLLP